MKFGPVPPAEAEGAVLAHQIRVGTQMLRKGHRLTAAECDTLRTQGVTAVTVARFEPGDIDENTAAAQLAAAICGPHITMGPAFTGRLNLFASADGVFLAKTEAVNAFNAPSDKITLATLPAFAPVRRGDMVATIKIIPFAVTPAEVTKAAHAMATTPLQLAPFANLRAALLVLALPGMKPSILDKTTRITEARLTRFGASLARTQRLPHNEAALQTALAALDPTLFDLLIIFGAAATVDENDLVPQALRACGAQILQFGMPVDPGNLLLLAQFKGKPVIGAPGCARSPKENGFDFVLARLCANLPVTPADLRAMGVGGLLTEITTRPQPRLGQPPINPPRQPA